MEVVTRHIDPPCIRGRSEADDGAAYVPEFAYRLLPHDLRESRIRFVLGGYAAGPDVRECPIDPYGIKGVLCRKAGIQVPHQGIHVFDAGKGKHLLRGEKHDHAEGGLGFVSHSQDGPVRLYLVKSAVDRYHFSVQGVEGPDAEIAVLLQLSEC